MAKERQGKAKWMDVWWFTGLWSDTQGSGCVRELMDEMICETPWWVEFRCRCACQHGLPRTSGSHPSAREARPKRFWHGDLKPRLACVNVCVCVCLCLHFQTGPYHTLAPDDCVHECICSCLSICEWACACTPVSEIDSRWSKDVQQRKGPAGSNCTEYRVYYQQHNRFKATCSLTVSITVTSYTLKRYNTTKVEINNRAHLF